MARGVGRFARGRGRARFARGGVGGFGIDPRGPEVSDTRYPSVIAGVIVGPRWHLYGPGYARFRTFSIEVNARKGHSRARRRIVLVDVPNYL